MKKVLILFLVLLFGIAFTQATDAKKRKKKAKYKVIEVTNGGSIEGKALFAGETVPKDEVLTLTSEQDLCGNTLPARKYIINGKNELKNAVVYIVKIKSGKKISTETAVIDNSLCAFEPHVSLGFKGKKNKVIIKNSDPVFHNTHSYIKGRTTFNLGLPEKGSQVEKNIRKSGLMSIKCDSHPWMLGYLYVLDHPYGAVTNEKGEFSINDIPAGSYEVKAWHEGFGDISLGNITVDAGKATMVKAEFK